MEFFSTRRLDRAALDGEAQPLDDRIEPFLVVLHGADRGRRFPLAQGETTIGRTAEAGLVIRDECISRVHCALTVAGDRLVVRDCGSQNGTFIDGVPSRRPRRCRRASRCGSGGPCCGWPSSRASNSRSRRRSSSPPPGTR